MLNIDLVTSKFDSPSLNTVNSLMFVQLKILFYFICVRTINECLTYISIPQEELEIFE